MTFLSAPPNSTPITSSLSIDLRPGEAELLLETVGESAFGAGDGDRRCGGAAATSCANEGPLVFRSAGQPSLCSTACLLDDLRHAEEVRSSIPLVALTMSWPG